MKVADASADTVHQIGEWCEAEGVDAWYSRAPPPMLASDGARHHGGAIGTAAVDGPGRLEVDAAELRSHCASPAFYDGIILDDSATVQPARLALGLREGCWPRCADLRRGSRRAHVRPKRGPVVETDGGRVRAKAVVLAIGPSSRALRPLRSRLSVTSSHIVLTEPVPDVVEELGWTGGESITDGRVLLHYFRTTRDGRILFGWAGGMMAAGARAAGRMDVDPDAVEQTRLDMLRIFPSLAGRRMDHAWGGPIDVSPTHLPAVVTLPGGRAFAAFGFTGNGVGPSHLAARSLASLALGRRDDASRLAIVDPPRRPVVPEPLRIAGAMVIRAGLVRKESAEERGERAGPISRRWPGCRRGSVCTSSAEGAWEAAAGGR